MRKHQTKAFKKKKNFYKTVQTLKSVKVMRNKDWGAVSDWRKLKKHVR